MQPSQTPFKTCLSYKQQWTPEHLRCGTEVAANALLETLHLLCRHCVSYSLCSPKLDVLQCWHLLISTRRKVQLRFTELYLVINQSIGWFTNISTAHQGGNMNVWSKFHSNASSHCWANPCKTQITDVIIINPLCTMNVCAKLHCSLSNSCWNNSD